MQIRQARATDIPALAGLCRQLGYSGDEQTVGERLEAIHGDPRHMVLVAEDEEGSVIGWVHVLPQIGLLSSDTAEIGGLVVDERARRRGVATALVMRAEDWARESGYQLLVVRSNVRREEAHQVYPALGFETVKEQRVYRKPLGIGP